jgi:hypothetical protein
MANRLHSFPVALLTTLLSGLPSAFADDALPEVTRMVRELRYEEALTRVEAVRREPASSPAVRLRALELAALAHLGLGHETDAREAFTRLLTLDPGAELTEQRPSPRVVELFQSVRESLANDTPTAGLLIDLDVPALEGASVSARARADGEHAIVRVVFRVDIGARSTEINAARGGPPWRAEIPVSNNEDLRRLVVVARGFAPSGRLSAVSPSARARAGVGPVGPGGTNGGGRDGDTYGIGDTPTGEGVRGEGLTGKWWFWGAIGAVVVGGTVTAIVLASGGEDEPRQGDLGSLQLSPAPE